MNKYNHDYAGIYKKAIIKLKGLFFRFFPSDKRRFLYRSYWNIYKKKKREHETEYKIYMTQEPNPLAGFGHGIDVWRNGINNAIYFGLEYAYCPMVSREWDQRLGLGEGLNTIKHLKRKGYRTVRLPYYNPYDCNDIDFINRIIDSYKGEKVIFLNEFEQPSDRSYGHYGWEFMRRQFWNSSERCLDKLIYEEHKINIAVHVRRGDVSKDSDDENIRMRWLDNAYYIELLKYIISESSNKEIIHIYIFSEGTPEDFSDFDQLNCLITYCLSMSVIESFIHMCRADMLLVGLSSFSADPGIINPSLKIVPSALWWNYPDNGEWIIADGQGSLSTTDRYRIREYLLSKSCE